MVQTDTIVGIVGAVVLVGVMAGVFVYEYNNQPMVDNGSGTSGDFAQMYPALAADEDIDGDGIANAEDDDIDGDGTDNGEDESLVNEEQVAGVSLDQHAPPVVEAQPYETHVFLGTGHTRFQAGGSYDSTTPTTSVAIELLDSEGNVVLTGDDNNGQVALQATDGELTPGHYTIRLSHTAASAETTFSDFQLTVSFAGGADNPDGAITP